MPEGAVYVGRPSMWGNMAVAPAEYAVEWFRKWLAGGIVTGPYMQRRRARILAEIHTLRGRDLACWCPLDRPCHADVLLELANKSEPPHAPRRPTAVLHDRLAALALDQRTAISSSSSQSATSTKRSETSAGWGPTVTWFVMGPPPRPKGRAA